MMGTPAPPPPPPAAGAWGSWKQSSGLGPKALSSPDVPGSPLPSAQALWVLPALGFSSSQQM